MDEKDAQLLLKAVRSLPKTDQDRVLTALFCQVIGPTAPFTRPVGPTTQFTQGVGPPGATDFLFVADPPLAGPSAMFPVRLPPELHDRLRGWSTEHGFSMAGVVRGLVERFLDEETEGRSSSRRATRGSRRRTTVTKTAAKPSARSRKRPTARG